MSNNTTYENFFFKIGLFNANGLTYEAIDNIINHLPIHTYILFITETWLLSPRRLNTEWEQQNTYGIKRRNSYTGQDGLSYIVHPDFPLPVIPIINNNPLHNKYTISCRIQNLIIHCFYLPPRLSDSLCMTIIQSFIEQYDESEYDVIFCGDFNARMGNLTGDYRTTNTTKTPRTNTRGTLMLPLIINNGLTLWNQKLCYGIPTYLTGSTNSTTNVKSSIIDLFLSSTTENLLCPEMSIATDLSLGSDHKLVTFAFQYHFNPSTVTTEQQHPRKLWKIKKLKPIEKRVKSESYEKNILNFTDTQQSSPSNTSDTIPSQTETQDTNYEQDNKYTNNYRNKIIDFFKNRVDPLLEQQSPSIDLINTAIVECIQQALDSSVGEQKARKNIGVGFGMNTYNKKQQKENNFTKNGIELKISTKLNIGSHTWHNLKK